MSTAFETPSATRTPSGTMNKSGQRQPDGSPGGQAGMNHLRGEYLTFRLGNEEYGIDILKVQEIRSYEVPTRIANAAACFKGVVNLRGVIVPIVDLRLKFGCDSVEYNSFTVVIVLNIRNRVVGAVVDSVSDVLELPGEAVRPAPDIDTSVDTSYITGIASIQDRMLILLDIESLMGGADMGLTGSLGDIG
jgi:purine-binding chemotaxis protein CheW